MNIVILAMCLFFPHAVSRSPMQAAGAVRRGHTQKLDNNQKILPSCQIPLVCQNQPETPKQEATEQRIQAEKHNVVITDLPPITVLPAKKDMVDWAYWGFGGLLAITGVLQLCLLLRSLKISSLQAKIARKQQVQMILAGQQTERIIAQAKEATQRQLRAYLGVSKVLLSFERPGLPEGLIEIENFGITPAYKVRQMIGIALGRYPAAELPEPANKSASGSVSVIHPHVKHVSRVTLKKTLPPNVILGTADPTVYVFGEVLYEDAFGQERRTAYRFFYGGTEGAQNITHSTGTILGVMNPDTNGNEAT